MSNNSGCRSCYQEGTVCTAVEPSKFSTEPGPLRENGGREEFYYCLMVYISQRYQIAEIYLVLSEKVKTLCKQILRQASLYPIYSSRFSLKVVLGLGLRLLSKSVIVQA